MTLETDTAHATERLVRVPNGIMALLRQSYDSRERVLDWMLAIGVACGLVYAFRDELRGFIASPEDANAGRTDDLEPNQNIPGAFPNTAQRPDLYSYNMPAARNIRYGIGPSSVPPPANPANPPAFPE